MADKPGKGGKRLVNRAKRHRQNMRTYERVQKRRKVHDDNHPKSPKTGRRDVFGPGNVHLGYVVTKNTPRKRWTTLPVSKAATSISR